MVGEMGAMAILAPEALAIVAMAAAVGQVR